MIITKVLSPKNMFMGEVVTESIEKLLLDFDTPQLRGKGIAIPWSEDIGRYKLIGISACFSQYSRTSTARTLIFNPYERKLYEFKKIEKEIGWRKRHQHDGIRGVVLDSRREKYIGWTTSERKDWNPFRDYIQDWYLIKGTAQDLIAELQKYSQPE